MNKDTAVAVAVIGALLIDGLVAVRGMRPAAAPAPGATGPGAMGPDGSVSWIKRAVSDLRGLAGGRGAARGSDPSDYSAEALSGYVPGVEAKDDGMTLSLGVFG